MTPLMTAVKQSRFLVVERLLDLGANVIASSMVCKVLF